MMLFDDILSDETIDSIYTQSHDDLDLDSRTKNYVRNSRKNDMCINVNQWIV